MKKVKSLKVALLAGLVLALVFILFGCSSDGEEQGGGDLPDKVFDNVFIAEGIAFVSGKADITEASFAYIIDIADVMKANTGVTFRIVGHTDDQGSEASNKKLSEDRAKAVMNFLINKGVRASSLEYQGKGIEQPIASNKTAEGRAKNRRIEIQYDGNFIEFPVISAS